MTETGFHLKHHLTSFQIMILGFAGVILLGALALMLPISAAGWVWTPFHEALFTSTSAVCVTGLVVQDTGSYWSAFGQAVTILLMLTGGAPGSTAGGMKVTTLAVLAANAVAAFRRREDPQLFKRRLEPSAVRNGRADTGADAAAGYAVAGHSHSADVLRACWGTDPDLRRILRA